MKIFARSLALFAALALVGIADRAAAQTGGRPTGGMGATGGTGAGAGSIGTNTGGIGGAGGTTGSATGSSGGRIRTATSPTNQAGATESISRSEDRALTDVGVATAGGTAGGLGGLGGLGLGGGGFGGLGGLSPFGMNPFGIGAGSSQSKPNLRTRLRSEVTAPPRAPGATVAITQRRVSKSLARPRFQGVGLAVTDSGAVLSGNVRSEADRRMAELLLRLEPGVDQVENQIIVSP